MIKIPFGTSSFLEKGGSSMSTPLAPRTLGPTGPTISAIGLGCWQFSLGKGMAGRFWPTLELSTIQDIVQASLEGGINWFDTAELYGRGESEKSLAHALVENRVQPGQVTIATKWWPMARGTGHLLSSINTRSNCLAPYDIDLYQIHQPYALASMRSQMDAMAQLVHEGKIKQVGVSNFNASQMRLAHKILAKHGIPLASNQVKYSLLDRKIERNGVLEVAKELNITIIAYSPLEQGLLTGRFHQDSTDSRPLTGPRKFQSKFRGAAIESTRNLIETLASIAEQYGKTVSQIALNWLVSRHGHTVVAIPGASKVYQARDNAGTLQFSLTESDLARIDAESRKVLSM
jgi:aryl-alcohol dehydrogenase-like predicted oxidoreductase